jgi:anti-sigma regulatory factor (Ser/Thr protein kinase)
VVEVLQGWGHPRTLLDDAKLVVSELATNAVVHAGSPFSVAIRPEGSSVRLSVSDGTRARASVSRDDRVGISGRELRLIDMLAVEWVVDVAQEGKTVWAELRP